MDSKTKLNKNCPIHNIEIPKNRDVILCDNLEFQWKQDKKGYFLVKIEKGMICCGFVNFIENGKHRMVLELRGEKPDKIIKEIAKRNLCNMENMGYISSELMIAYDCLKNNKNYVQR